MQISDRSLSLAPSATITVSQLVTTLRDQGKDIISLSIGEPDFDTPDFVKQAAIDAINNNQTHYTAVDGIMPLKEAIINKLANENNLSYKPSQILVSVGAKHSYYNLTQALINEGDQVIIPRPYWVSYPDIAKLAGAEPIFIDSDMDSGFKISAQQLEAAITDKTRLFILNTPSNPTGAEYNRQELAALGEVLKHHPNVIIATDEIYEHTRWSQDPYLSLLNVCPELTDQTVIINGVSKAYAMTGWRIGYAAGPSELIKNMKKLQSQMTSCPCSISQHAAIAALNSGTDCIKPMVAAFQQRHDKVVAALNNTAGFKCIPVQAALYVFANVEGAMAQVQVDTDTDFAKHLIEKAGVAVVPGSAFGMPGYVRISIAAANEKIYEALERIQTTMQS